SSAGRPMPAGRRPGPGGWNRIQLIVEDLPAEVSRLRAGGLRFRNDIVTGPGGPQILIDDPSGNPIELFQPARRDRGASTRQPSGSHAALLALTLLTGLGAAANPAICHAFVAELIGYVVV